MDLRFRGVTSDRRSDCDGDAEGDLRAVMRLAMNRAVGDTLDNLDRGDLREDCIYR